MNDMRKLINLMEGVMAVPGMGQVGGSESDMQTAGTVGRNASYAEFDSAQQPATESNATYSGEDTAEVYKHHLDALTARLLPMRKAGKRLAADALYSTAYDSLSRAFPKGQRAYAGAQNDRMWAGNNWQRDDKSGRSAVDEEAPPGMEDVVMKLKKQYPDDHSRAYATAWSIYNKKHGKADEGVAGAAAGGIAGAVLTKSPSGAMAGANLGSELQDAFGEGVVLSEPDEDDDVKESVPAIDSCNQANPANADVACAMEEREEGTVLQLAKDRYDTMADQGMEHEEIMDRLQYEMALDGQDPGTIISVMQQIEDVIHPDRDDDYDDSMDGDFDSAMASTGHGSDEDYGYYGGDGDMYEAKAGDINADEVKALVSLPPADAKAKALEIVMASRTGDAKKQYLARQINNARNTMEVIKLMYNMILAGEGNAVQGTGYSKRFNNVEEAYDLNNGYHDVDVASGDDYFPNGADSPVVKATGPSGARQGDNPEQKKMQVAETHKELVYAYRSFLKESATPVQKKKLTENVEVADFKIYDYYDSFDEKGDLIVYNGTLDVEAKVRTSSGQVHEIMFSVDVESHAGLEWVSDEEPTGWNYKSDSPTYTSYSYARAYDPAVKSVKPISGTFIIDKEEVTEEDFHKVIDPMTMKELLNPALYAKALGPYFDKKTEGMEAGDNDDYYEPERGESRY